MKPTVYAVRPAPGGQIKITDVYAKKTETMTSLKIRVTGSGSCRRFGKDFPVRSGVIEIRPHTGGCVSMDGAGLIFICGPKLVLFVEGGTSFEPGPAPVRERLPYKEEFPADSSEDHARSSLPA